MNHAHFGLEKSLFGDGIATESAVFRSLKHEQLVASFKLALGSPSSVIVLRGRAGVGKTTLTSTALRASSTRLALAWLNGTPTNAAELLRVELGKRGYACSPINLGANTDPYQPIERRWRVTRSVLEVLAECGHPCTIITKNALIERDLDLLVPMAKARLVHAFVSVTSLDNRLSSTLEPLLFQVEPSDVVTLATVPVVLVVVALVAALIPARRATQVDPIQALRTL